MSTKLITGRVWPELTKAIRGSRRSCAVAVAYLGAGASRLLPLHRGSHLVVDASEHAVTSGQTSPTDLGRLLKRGVKVYSVPNLHAKVFVVGQSAYIGSANVSSRSASQLVEAIVRVTEPTAVRAARQFVYEHCLHELTPTVLKRLGKRYRPPHIIGGKRGKRSNSDTPRRPMLPRLLLAQLQREDWSERDQALHDSALAVAEKRRKHPRSFELDSFRYVGNCPYWRGDVVIQITDEGRRRMLMSPPGNVLYVRTRSHGRRRVSFVYLECPVRRRRQVKVVARTLGRGSPKRLRRNGFVRDAAFAQALLGVWRD